MALVAQPVKVQARKTMAIITDLANEVNKFFRENDQTVPPLDATYKSGRVAAAQASFEEMVAAAKWAVAHTDFGLSDPAALDDAAMLLKDPELLEFDDGT